MTRLDLTRAQILAYRRRVQALDRRLPAGADSLRQVAWAGLQDSMPRAALLSIHARVEKTQPSTWEDPSLVQLWGPRFGAYVVARPDIAVFTLGRIAADPSGLKRAETTAARLHAFLDGRTMTYGEAGHAMGIHPNALRYAAPTGTVHIRWDGARQPTIWTVPAPRMDRARRSWSSLAATFASSAWRRPRHLPLGRASGRQEAAPRSMPSARPWRPFEPLSAPAGSSRATRRPSARRPRPRRTRGSSRAGTRTSSSRGPIASSWSRRPIAAASCGRHASGLAPFSSAARSSERGDVPAPR